MTRDEESKVVKDSESHSSRGILAGERNDEEKKEPASMIGVTGTPNQSLPVVVDGRHGF